MQIIQNRDELFAAMKNGALVITPNNRLSNQLLHDYYEYTAPGLAGMPCDKARCLPYQAFLRILFKKARHLYAHLKHPILLSGLQQRYLWQQILTKPDETCNEGLRHEIQEAWTRCEL